MADRPRPRRTVSPERKSLYTAGVGLQVAAGIGFAVCLVGFAVGGFHAVESFGTEGSPLAWWIAALLCMVAAAAGQMMRTVAARGVAGSGLVLDPERAREDLEPWARAGGGLLKDAIDEAGLGRPGGSTEVVTVRCRQCRTLNDEHARFCDHCGAPM